MPDKLIVLLLALFSIVGMTIGNASFRDDFRGSSGNTSLSLSEDKKTITIRAEYPKHKAPRVHQFVREHFHLTDISDLHHVDVKEYATPDGFMVASIKSGDGFLKITLEKRRNTMAAYDNMRPGLKQLQAVLAGE